MTTAALPSDVQRVLTWEELPPSVREIPRDFNPMAKGVLMRHQADWLKVCATEDLAIAKKGRRTGITYATALDHTIIAASSRAAGGDNVYYIADTKDKGLEFVGYCAHMARVMSQAMADGWQGIEVTLFEDVRPDGSTKMITAYRIRFASGFQIVALSSNPASLRGLQGIIIIDEAAFHRNVQAVLDAASAMIIWGGKIRIISTHNGAKNAFNQLVLDAEAGRSPFKVFTATFDDAVANGLYERVCLIKGWTPTPEGKRAWYLKVRGTYGSNLAAMREELDCIPRDGSGVALPAVLIERAMREERPILRLALDADFAAQDPELRKYWCDEWMRVHLFPVLTRLDPALEHYFGHDFARHRDFSIFTPLALDRLLTKRVPFILEMHKVPTRQQEQILWTIIDRLPNFRAGAMDATGSGETLAEYTGDKYGSRILQIKLNDAWYRSNMGQFVAGFEDGLFDLPRDANLRNDLRSLELIDGIIKLPGLTQKDLTDTDLKRHGDGAISLALANHATLAKVNPGVEVHTAAPRASTAMLRGYRR